MMQIGEIIRGFELISVTPVHELNAQFHLFRHQKTGAELLWTCRADENKTFSAAFKTLPEDSTGVFHILEHSVLCGSDKYPVKEPFVELLKGSMQTFLNAMTFPDKTVYPVASRNDADFRNLMSVYLDAVFCPNLLRNPHIFEQEGWHYEPAEDGRQHVVGVVYGEMEGAYSSVDRKLMARMEEQLFPDNCYGLSSGGDPVHIPELTYEQFVATYKRYYHPSNARFFLDGSVDLDTAIADICEYVDRFERRDPDFALTWQQPVSSVLNDRYEIAKGEDQAHKCYFSMGKIMDRYDDIETELAMEILGAYLCGTNQSPMKRRVLERGLGQEFYQSGVNGIQQNAWCLTVRNTDEDKLPILREELRKIAREILDEGIDREELTACINQFEFSARERQEPYGVYMNISVLSTWLYGGDPAQAVQWDRAFAAVRSMLDTDAFEQLLTRWLLDDEGMCEVRLTPSETLGDENRAAAQARADAATAGWSDAQKAAQQKLVEELNAWHQRPDSAEELATIPHLHLADVSAEPLWMPSQEKQVCGVSVRQTEVGTNGAVYLEVVFDLGDLRADQLSDASLLAMLYTQLPTAQYDTQTLQRMIRLHLGGLDFRMQSVTAGEDPDHCTPYLRVMCSVLEHEVDEAVRLMQEILTTTRFDDAEAIRTIMQQRVAMMKQRAITSGNGVAIMNAAAYQSAEGFCDEQITGFAFLRYLEKQMEAFDGEAVAKALCTVAGKLNASCMSVCISGHITEKQEQALCSMLPRDDSWQKTVFTLPEYKATRTAMEIPAAVGFATIGCNYLRMGDYPRGTLSVMTKLLALNQLWNEIRVQGGAYGAGIYGASSGMLTTYSYRDPNPQNSLRVYRSMADYLETYCREEKPLDDIIIGVMSDADPLMSPKVQSQVVMTLALRGQTQEKERSYRRQIVSTGHAELLKCCQLLRDMAEKGSVCVVGNAPMLEQLAAENLTKLN